MKESLAINASLYCALDSFFTQRGEAHADHLIMSNKITPFQASLSLMLRDQRLRGKFLIFNPRDRIDNAPTVNSHATRGKHVLVFLEADARLFCHKKSPTYYVAQGG